MCLQTDDTASAGKESYILHESKQEKLFDIEPTQKLADRSTSKYRCLYQSYELGLHHFGG